MRSAPVILSLALFCAYCRVDASAQTDTTLVRAIARQKVIRIQAGPGGKLELRQPRIEGLMLVGQVGAESGWAEYPIEGISQVWRRGSGAGVGFMVGALIGAAGGAAAGAALANFCMFSCVSTSGSEKFAVILGGGLVGGLAVGGVGALFGAMTTRWKSVYKARAVGITPIITPHRLGMSLTF